ncbi:hypothetical protein EVAR_94679_1 [Eumeta japonica]|uniref:Uncharacterized protein n=1 Tax=Eumeta variegata TaxID=151549 RepID=A0A4C1UW38_EUMVA|nr:hypothetical protein EVAR_94679_1 [Eumeta japonica]
MLRHRAEEAHTSVERKSFCYRHDKHRNIKRPVPLANTSAGAPFLIDYIVAQLAVRLGNLAPYKIKLI